MNKQGKPIFEVHTWETLSPFFNIARMIDVMTLFIKIMLIAIVLISIMNVMIMAVYERIREIGTIAAIGTLPGKILSMFVIEGFSLGILGAVVGQYRGIADCARARPFEDHLQFRNADRPRPFAVPAGFRHSHRLGDRHRRCRAGEPPARTQGVADGAHRGPETRMKK